MLGHAVDITDCLGLRHVADFIQDLLRSDADGKVEQLTRREREILDMIGSGLSDARIADRLSLSVHTVSTHRRNMLRKMGAPNAAALVHTAVSRGITSFDAPKTNGILAA